MERFELVGPAGKLSGFSAGQASSASRLPVVLVHGINMSSDVWKEVAALLAHERRVVALDLRGHGASDKAGPFGAEDYASDVLATLDHLGLARVHVAGTSFGGGVACAVAARSPARVASLTAVGSALAVAGLDVEGAIQALRAVGVRPFFAAFLPQSSFAPGTDPALVERALGVAVEGRDVETVIGVSRTALASDLTATGAAVRVPALVVTGELDATCPPALGAAMARTLRAEHRVIPGRGHVLSLEDPAATARAIAEHAAAHEARA
ncbi:MAG TPA: alpha/beta hydrolase [Nevskiaceae bacterium]|nr:alpha/beta hydrolase [Nevskiaceae bacterium]